MKTQFFSPENPLICRLGQLFVDDLDLAARERPWSGESLDEIYCIAGDFVAGAKDVRLIYTAFDGDHQELSPLMRRAALRRGYVPVNPDSVLGYKETIEARYNKADVLRDDLSVLRGCDELWIFTDLEPDSDQVGRLAEGVQVELTYFLKHHARKPIRLVSIAELLVGREDPREVSLTLPDLAAALPAQSRQSISSIANGGPSGGGRIPPLCYFVIDPLDYKYCRFLREAGYRLTPARKTAPVVPNLAVEVSDLGSGLHNIGSAVACWALLMQIAAECYVYPSMETRRCRSKVAAFLEQVWLQNGRGTPVNKGLWANHNIPKAKLGDGWPITTIEKGKLRTEPRE